MIFPQSQSAPSAQDLSLLLDWYLAQHGKPFSIASLPRNYLSLSELQTCCCEIELGKFVHPQTRSLLSIPWEIPDGGCFAKASWIQKGLKARRIESVIVVVESAESDGLLSMESSFARGDEWRTSWRSHAAVLVEIANEKGEITQWVIDPLLSPWYISVDDWSRTVFNKKLEWVELEEVLRQKTRGRRGGSLESSALYIIPEVTIARSQLETERKFANLAAKWNVRHFGHLMWRFLRNEGVVPEDLRLSLEKLSEKEQVELVHFKENIMYRVILQTNDKSLQGALRKSIANYQGRKYEGLG